VDATAPAITLRLVMIYWTAVKAVLASSCWLPEHVPATVNTEGNSLFQGGIHFYAGGKNAER